MPIDFTNIPEPSELETRVDPIELFQSLQVKDSAINDLWLAQGDALREWHANRQSNDIAIVLNTGAGKTLVGLLAAQSLVNETKGKVVYACSSLQLVEQTIRKAAGYGIEVTTYAESQWTNEDAYLERTAACVTTYQALFNGRSRFFRQDEIPDVIIFDDSHSAEHLLRDAFTLRVPSSTSLYGVLSGIFRPYFADIGQEIEYIENTESGSSRRLVYVPPFVLKQNTGSIREALLAGDLESTTQTKFAWEHIRNNFDLCCVFVSGRHIEFTPPIIPTSALPYFQNNIRRLYLSATMSAPDAFLRTFGKLPNPIIAPKTSAGECERMILVPARSAECMDEEIEIAKKAVVDQKALILVPSQWDAAKWMDFLEVDDESNVTQQVEKFKRAEPPAKLLLKARYDGVDLPGDTCRVMIIDNLPSGIGTLERFLWERLGLNVVLRSTIASRVVQSFGRISRGMSDYGVVLITGNLLKWLLIPENQQLLPDFLQNQIMVGLILSSNLHSAQEFADGVRQCLDRDDGWLSFYKERMSKITKRESFAPDGALANIASTESGFIEAFWRRDFRTASTILSTNLDSTFAISSNAGAWHSLWLGYCYDLLGDIDAAADFYDNAHRVQKNIAPWNGEGYVRSDSVAFQISEVAKFLRMSESRVRAHGFRNFRRDLSPLDGSGTVKQTEAAIQQLGLYLGLNSTRPDTEFGTGPDVLWEAPDMPAFCLELKTDKKKDSKLSKSDIGQMHNHIEWCSTECCSDVVIPAFVGAVTSAEANASPSQNMCVVSLESFRELASRLHGALDDIVQTASATTLADVISEKFQERDLLWPGFLGSLTPIPLREAIAND